MRPYSSMDWDTLLHIILNSDTDWDRSVIDSAK